MKTWDECRNESDLSVMVKFSKNVTTYTVQKRCSPAPATHPRAYLRDVTCLGSDDASSDDSSSLDSSCIAPKCWRAWASNSLHTKFATTSCIFHVNFNLSILRLSTLNPSIKMNCQTAISYRGLRKDNKFEEGMMRERANSRGVTIDYALPQASGWILDTMPGWSLVIVGHSRPQCLWVLLFMRRRALGRDWSSGHLQNVVFVVHVYCVNANSRFEGKTCTPPIFRSPWSGNLFLRLSERSTSSP